MNVASVYTAASFRSGDRYLVAGGSETTGDVRLYDISDGTSEPVDGCPGGVMSFVPVPGRGDLYYSIMGLFPGFVGQEAGVYRHRRTADGWVTDRAFALPFAHRCDVITRDGSNYLFAVSVSRFKADPADWSRAGDIYVMKLDPETGDPGEAVLVDSSVYRNHGMLKMTVDGRETLMVSGAEGIFSLELSADGKWGLQRIFDRETSEFGFVDFDGDGKDELVTIEPFHGDGYKIYRNVGGGWKCIHAGELSFGHGLSCGMFNGTPVAVAGCRRDSLALKVIRLENGVFTEEIAELEAGPTQTQVFSFGGTDYILSAGQKKNEVALYTL